MNKRNFLFSNLLLLVFLAVSAFPQSKLETKSTSENEKLSSPMTGEKVEQDVAEALTFIENNYIDGKKLDYNELFKSSIKWIFTAPFIYHQKVSRNDDLYSSFRLLKLTEATAARNSSAVNRIGEITVILTGFTGFVVLSIRRTRR